MADKQRTPVELRRMADRTREISTRVDDEIARMLRRFAASYEAEAAAAERSANPR